MKKLALILALMIIPCSAFGLEMLNDSAMDGITGQSGVSIAMDDVQLFINIEKMAYIDCDGFNTTSGYGNCTGAPGAITLANFQIDVLNINAIVTSVDNGDGGIQSPGVLNDGSMSLYSTSCGQIPLFYDYGSTVDLGGCYLGEGTNPATDNKGLNHYYQTNGSGFTPAALSIDVSDRLPTLTEGKQNILNSNVDAVNSGWNTLTVGGVLITIPTLEIYINSMTLTPKFDGDISGRSSEALNDDSATVYGALNGVAPGSRFADFGTFVLQGITFTTLSGWIEIAPH